MWGERAHGDLLLVCGGGELGWVPVLSMVWEYGASGRGRVRGGAGGIPVGADGLESMGPVAVDGGGARRWRAGGSLFVCGGKAVGSSAGIASSRNN